MNAPAPIDLPFRIGQGWDTHVLVEGRPLVLGGVTIDWTKGLLGHSDADALLHAITDAVLGGAGLGDIGQHFPDTDPKWKGADSIEILRTVASMLANDGWNIGNVDCSVVCERPKLAPARDAMQAALSSAAGAPVTVKGRRAEGLGAIGRSEGIACFASAVVTRD